MGRKERGTWKQSEGINSLVSQPEFHFYPNKISSKDKLKFNSNLTFIKIGVLKFIYFFHFLLCKCILIRLSFTGDYSPLSLFPLFPLEELIFN